jgi:hypothetical protein
LQHLKTILNFIKTHVPGFFIQTYEPINFKVVIHGNYLETWALRQGIKIV